MSLQLTSRELAELVERLRLFNSIPPEQRIDVSGVVRQHCTESTQLFATVYGDEPTENETIQLCEHIKQCIPCGAFLRYMWRVTSRAGY